MRKLKGLFSASIFLSLLTAVPSYANNWCQRHGANIEPCLNNIVPKDWVWCGNFNRDSIWCHPSSHNHVYENNDANTDGWPFKFYIGASIAKNLWIGDGIKADYANESDAWRAPGSFNRSKFNDNNAPVFQLSFGGAVNENLRFDLSYASRSNISVKFNPDRNFLYMGGIEGRDPNVSSNAMMLNVYYNLDDIIGRFKLRPYVGAGIGLANNTISDYTVTDWNLYYLPGMVGTNQPAGTIVAWNYLRTNHSGKTNKNNFAYALEAGATQDLIKGFFLDFLIRWTYLGRVESDGVLVVYDVYASNGVGLVGEQPINNGSPLSTLSSYFPGRKESGNLSALDIGMRLRFQF